MKTVSQVSSVYFNVCGRIADIESEGVLLSADEPLVIPSAIGVV